jgi:hypothetical protein
MERGRTPKKKEKRYKTMMNKVKTMTNKDLVGRLQYLYFAFDITPDWVWEEIDIVEKELATRTIEEKEMYYAEYKLYKKGWTAYIIVCGNCYETTKEVEAEIEAKRNLEENERVEAEIKITKVII